MCLLSTPPPPPLRCDPFSVELPPVLPPPAAALVPPAPTLVPPGLKAPATGPPTTGCLILCCCKGCRPAGDGSHAEGAAEEGLRRRSPGVESPPSPSTADPPPAPRPIRIPTCRGVAAPLSAGSPGPSRVVCVNAGRDASVVSVEGELCSVLARPLRRREGVWRGDGGPPPSTPI